MLVNFDRNIHYVKGGRAKGLECGSKKWGKLGIPGYEPSVHISTVRHNSEVRVEVKDNGSGIPSTHIKKIFQPFFTTKPTGEGTGLGLSLSYDMVTKGHGGELKVASEPGKGTVFTVVLP
jgi:signal transduction histidine kinase